MFRNFVLMLSFLSFFSNALASSFILLSKEDLLNSADAVVLGRVVSIESARDLDGNIRSYIGIKVERDFFNEIPPQNTIYLREYGGRSDGVSAWAFGSPEFELGEQAVVFVRVRLDGFFEVAHLFQGKFAMDRPGRLAQRIPREALVFGRDRAGFQTVEEIEQAAGSRLPRGIGWFATGLTLPRSEKLARFTLRGIASEAGEASKGGRSGPHFFTLEGARWHQFDSSISVPFYVNSANAPPTTSPAAAVTSTVQAWDGIPATRIVMTNGGSTNITLRNPNDSTNVVLFGDPGNEIQDLVNCSGTLAITYILYGLPTRVVNATTFYQLYDSDTVFNNGVECALSLQANLAEVTGHELGHGIGLAHSSENPNEVNPVLKDALMYFLAHLDGRGASPRADDISGAQFIYPGVSPSSAANFFTLTPCRVIDTRNATGPYGGPALSANTDRTFTVAGQCGIPATAKAVSVNLTVNQPTNDGDLRVYPSGASLPNSSVINYRVGQTRANNAIVPLSALGAFNVRCDQVSGTVHFILDVNGYFQ